MAKFKIVILCVGIFGVGFMCAHVFLPFFDTTCPTQQQGGKT